MVSRYSGAPFSDADELQRTAENTSTRYPSRDRLRAIRKPHDCVLSILCRGDMAIVSGVLYLSSLFVLTEGASRLLCGGLEVASPCGMWVEIVELLTQSHHALETTT